MGEGNVAREATDANHRVGLGRGGSLGKQIRILGCDARLIISNQPVPKVLGDHTCSPRQNQALPADFVPRQMTDSADHPPRAAFIPTSSPPSPSRLIHLEPLVSARDPSPAHTFDSELAGRWLAEREGSDEVVGTLEVGNKA